VVVVKDVAGIDVRDVKLSRILLHVELVVVVIILHLRDVGSGEDLLLRCQIAGGTTGKDIVSHAQVKLSKISGHHSRRLGDAQAVRAMSVDVTRSLEVPVVVVVVMLHRLRDCLLL